MMMVVLVMHGTNGAASFGDSVLTSLEAYTIDAKLDDGGPASGIVMVHYAAGPWVHIVGYANGCTANNGPGHPATYDINGEWLNHPLNLPETTGLHPERVDCSIAIGKQF